jgi:hypothetical protein
MKNEDEVVVGKLEEKRRDEGRRNVTKRVLVQD